MSNKARIEPSITPDEIFLNSIEAFKQNPNELYEFLKQFSNDHEKESVVHVFLNYLASDKSSFIICAYILSYLIKNERVPSKIEDIIMRFLLEPPLPPNEIPFLPQLSEECSILCSYLNRKLPNKLSLLQCVISALQLVANTKHELTHMDCILMEVCEKEQYYEIGLRYAVRPVFGISSKTITTPLLASYFLSAIKICCVCGQYRSALSASKMGLASFVSGEEEKYHMPILQYFYILSLLNSVDERPNPPSNVDSLVMSLQKDGAPFLDFIGRFSIHSQDHPDSSNFLTQMSYRSPDPDVLRASLTADTGIKDPLLISLIEKAIENLRMVQHIRMMHTFGKATLRDLSLALHTKTEADTIRLVIQASRSQQGVQVNVDQREHIVTFDDDPTAISQQKEAEGITTLYKALTELGPMSQSINSLLKEIPSNPVLTVIRQDDRH